MKERPARTDAIRHISAIGAGVLLAATPHCGGKSEGKSDDDSGGGTRSDSGGASGSAGYGGFVGQPPGGYGGSYGGSYGGFVGVPSGGYGGSYGGAVGTGGCPSTVEQRCFTPEELFGCLVGDGGIEAGPDTGVGGTDGTGEGGMAGEASEVQAAPRTIIREAGIAPPPFTCPAGASFPACVTPTTPLPPGNVISTLGWNGDGCCYVFGPYCY